MRSFHLIMALAILLLAIPWFLYKKAKPPAPVRQVTTETASPGSFPGQAAPSPPGESSWSEGTAECARGECKIRITVEVRKVGPTGDMAAIEYDLKKASREKMTLLTVEPLSTTATMFQTAGKKIPLEDLYKGGTYEFSLPMRDKPLQFGIFLCKDMTSVNRCLGKHAGDLFQVIAFDAMNLKSDPGFKSPDMLFFFQYAVLDKGKVSALSRMRADDLSDEVFEAHRQQLERRSPEEKVLLGRDLASAKHLTRVMRSYPLELNGSEIRLVLPGQSKK